MKFTNQYNQIGFHAWTSLFHPYLTHPNGRCPQGCLERSDLEDLLKDSVSVEYMFMYNHS